MKSLGIAVLLATSMTGCISLFPKDATTIAKKTPSTAPSSKPVSADQVTDSNARDMSIALSLELDQAQSSLAQPADNKGTANK
jgi:hypothetical protein